MQTLTKQEYFKIESTQSEDSVPPKEHIKKCVYDPYGELEQSEWGEDDEHPISLEELEQEEKKTKRPNHQRPLTKLYIIGFSLIPVFAFIYLFMGGTKKPAQIARAIQQAEPQVDQELVSQNQQLQKQIDQMELELAKLKQQQNSPPSPAPKPEVKKVETPPPPPKQPPVKTTPKPVAQKPVSRPKPVQKKPAPTRPTPEQLMRRRQLLAQSVVFGGTIPNNQQSILTVSQSEYEPEITSSPNPALVSSRNQPNQALLVSNLDNSPAVQEPIDFSIGSPQSNSRQSLTIHKQLTKQFTPGTSISGESLHPAFFSSGQSTTVNMRVTDSNTPVPEGTNLSVELREINGAVTVTSIQAEVNNEVRDLEASNWQVTASDGMPLVANPVEQPSDGQWSNTASNVLRNTRRVYRTDDVLTSTLIGVGSTIAEGQMNRNTRRVRNRPSIRVIEQNTPIKLFVIQPFGI